MVGLVAVDLPPFVVFFLRCPARFHQPFQYRVNGGLRIPIRAKVAPNVGYLLPDLAWTEVPRVCGPQNTSHFIDKTHSLHCVGRAKRIFDLRTHADAHFREVLKSFPKEELSFLQKLLLINHLRELAFGGFVRRPVRNARVFLVLAIPYWGYRSSFHRMELSHA